MLKGVLFSIAGYCPPWDKRRKDMKLCVSSTGREKNSRVDTAFGRAPFFLIIDMESRDLKVVANSSAAAGHGAGIAAAQIVSDAGVDAVLSGYVGPNAFNALHASGIKVFEGATENETVQEAIERYTRGEYQEKTAQTIGPGCGTGKGPGMGRGRGRGRGGCRMQ
jgi:predicted Fe-Mo cluster-binding NifX family protein